MYKRQAQDIPDAKEVQNDEGVTLHLRQCSGCGLVQFDCEPVAYYRDVIRAGGGSSTMRELRASQYRHLIETYHLEGKTFFEAGCGRGEFLKFLQEFPVEIYGMEHLSLIHILLQCPGSVQSPAGGTIRSAGFRSGRCSRNR